MNKVVCEVCGKAMVRYGKTAAGSQRWRCTSCGITRTNKIDNTAKRLKEFLAWLFSKQREADMPGGGRTFRRRTSEFWEIWPIAPQTGEIFDVLFLDGIYLAKNVVVLVCASDEGVVSWHLAKSENSTDYKALMRRIPPPRMVVSDGGAGFEKARRTVWPETKVQRCLFHVFNQIRRHTTLNPKLDASRELLSIATSLLHIENLSDAGAWIDGVLLWCTRWQDFLSEKIPGKDGKLHDAHEHLVKARNSLVKLVRQGTLFTYLDPLLTSELGRLPAFNNRLEGGVNAQLKQMLREHRGLSLMRRAKAVFWWCYMHSPSPLPAAEMLRSMPSDKDIEKLYHNIFWESKERVQPAGLAGWGDGLVWAELTHQDTWRVDWS